MTYTAFEEARLRLSEAQLNKVLITIVMANAIVGGVPVSTTKEVISMLYPKGYDIEQLYDLIMDTTEDLQAVKDGNAVSKLFDAEALSFFDNIPFKL